MKKQLLTAMMMMAALGVLAVSSPVYAQAGDGSWGNGPGEFIDADGDGFNDLAPDADGDGIPNAYDEDFVPPQDGTGAGYGGSGNGLGDGTGEGNGRRAGGAGVGGPGDGTGDCIADPLQVKPQFKVLLAR